METSRTLLSSRTVFKFSIQMASIGPSSTIQVFWLRFLVARRQSTANMPSVQSPVTNYQGVVCHLDLAVLIGYTKSVGHLCLSPYAQTSAKL